MKENAPGLADFLAGSRDKSSIRAFLDGIGEARASLLPENLRIRMLESFSSGEGLGYSDQSWHRLLLCSLPFSKPYLSWRAVREEKTVSRLLGDAGVRRGISEWDRLGMDDRKTVLSRVVQIHSDVFMCYPALVAVMNEGPRACASGSKVRKAKFCDGTITLNLHPEAELSGLGAALEAVLHENAHNHQQQLSLSLGSRDGESLDAVQRQFRIFSLNWMREGAYTSRLTDARAYEAQPMEVDARESSKAILDALLKGLSGNLRPAVSAQPRLRLEPSLLS